MHRSGRERLSRQAARHRQAVFACEGVDAAMNAEIENATEEIELKLLLEALWQRYQVDFRGYALRSEEHTSELQSLMRISYAVFCLTNKTYTLTSTYIPKVNNASC